VSLLYSLAVQHSADIKSNSVQIWVCFELPFYFINAASLIVYFEWRQISHFLKSPKQKTPESLKTSMIVVSHREFRGALNNSENADYFVDANQIDLHEEPN
jgi:hypothetical protein